MHKLIFMGTPHFAVPTLQALLDAGYHITAVYTQPPRPAGRGQKEAPSPVQLLAEANGLPVFTPVSLKSPEVQAQFAGHGADAAVVAAYGLLLPVPILTACPHGCLNVHPSLLPRWRGAAPIQRTLMAGDTQTGVAIMQMDAGLDTGDVLELEPFTIPDAMNAGSLHDELAARGAQAMLHVLAKLGSAELKPQRQAEEGITYADKITKADCRINWARDAHAIRNQIRGLSPSPGATFELNGETFKVFEATAAGNASEAPPGTVLNEELLIACGRGTLAPLVVQRPGKKRMSVREMLAGFSIPQGTVLK